MDKIEKLVESLDRVGYNEAVCSSNGYLSRLFYQSQEVELPLPIKLDEELQPFVGSLIVEKAGKIYSEVRIVPFNGLFFVVDSHALASTGGRDNYYSHKPGMYGLVGSDGMIFANYILSQIKGHQFESGLDLCTGSGVVGISLSAFFESMHAVDIDEASIPWARFNARINRRSNFSCMHGDLYEPVRGSGPYEVITANPSYAFYSEEFKEEYQVKEHEVGGDYGLELILQIIDGYDEFLDASGTGYICTLTPILNGRDYLIDRLEERYSQKGYRFEVYYNHCEVMDDRLKDYYASLGISRFCFVYIKTVKSRQFQIQRKYSSLYYISKFPIPRKMPHGLKRFIKKVLLPS